jgi:hypothetical protein
VTAGARFALLRLVAGAVMISFSAVFVKLASVSGLTAQARLGIVFGLLTALFYSGYLLSLRQARLTSTERTPAGDLALVPMTPTQRAGAALALVAIYLGSR